MRTSVNLFAVSALVLAVAMAVTPPSAGSLLLPLLDRQESLLSDRLPDPFRVMEHIPFGLDRDEPVAVPTARVDWKETADAHHILIDVPGLKKEELKIEVLENRVLRISGERRREEDKKGDRWHCVERAHGRFWRQFRLPENADLDSIYASLQDGVLAVKLKKLAPDQVKGPKVVSIYGGEQPAVGAGEAKKVEL